MELEKRSEEVRSEETTDKRKQNHIWTTRIELTNPSMCTAVMGSLESIMAAMVDTMLLVSWELMDGKECRETALME